MQLKETKKLLLTNSNKKRIYSLTKESERNKHNNSFNNLQVGDNDLIGNKFNGHDIHLYLKERGVKSSHLVWNKESDDPNTFIIGGDKSNREELRNYNHLVKSTYHLDNIYGTDAYDILYNKLFLEADVVHFHLLHNLCFDLNLLPLISKLKPIVWTIHDPWILSGHCVHHFDCNRWKTGCGDCPMLEIDFKMSKDNTALNLEIKRQALQNSHLEIIVASNWLKDKIERTKIFHNSNIHLVPFGVNHSIFKPGDKTSLRKKMGIPENAIVILARCTKNIFKGFDFVEYTLDHIHTKKDVYLLLLQEGISNKNEHKNYMVKEYGWVKDDYLLADIYAVSDLFLMPSKVETFGMMAIESMSCGLLPIVLEGTALPEIVNSPKCGVATKRSKDEFYKQVQYYIDNEVERIQRAQMCFEYARKFYNKDVYIDRIIKVYKKALNEFKIDKSMDFLINQLKKNVELTPISKIIYNSDSGITHDTKSKPYLGILGKIKKIPTNLKKGGLKGIRIIKKVINI